MAQFGGLTPMPPGRHTAPGEDTAPGEMAHKLAQNEESEREKRNCLKSLGRRGGRVAEGNGLLNRHRAKSLVAGSNPALSATKAREMRDARDWREVRDATH